MAGALDRCEPVLLRKGGGDDEVWCMTPLKGLAGRAFGVLASGPPALPVEFVEQMANAAGPLMEEAWRRQMLSVLLDVAVGWVRSLCGDTLEGEGEGVQLVPGPGPKTATPLSFPLRWLNRKLPEGRIGTLSLSLKRGAAPLNAHQEKMLAITAPLLQDSVHEIERMHVGQAGEARLFPSSPLVGYGAEAVTRLLLPRLLLARVSTSITTLDEEMTSGCVSELRAYHQPHRAVGSTLSGVLTLLGRRLSQLEVCWDNVHGELDNDLIEELAACDPSLDAGDGSGAQQWAESDQATKELTSDSVRETLTLRLSLSLSLTYCLTRTLTLSLSLSLTL